jgi:hypothetical protein
LAVRFLSFCFWVVCYHDNRHFRRIFPDFLQEFEAILWLVAPCRGGTYPVAGEYEVAVVLFEEINRLFFVAGKVTSDTLAC